MTSPSIVRPAVPEDRDEIWRMFRLLHAENAMLPISEIKVDYYLNRFLHPNTIAPDDTGVRGAIGVIGNIGSLEGFIIITIGGQWYSNAPSIDEWANYVDPDHRSSLHAKALITHAIKIMDDVLATTPDIKLIIGILSHDRTAAKIRLYSQFLEPAGCFFVYPKLKITDTKPMWEIYRQKRDERVAAHNANTEHNQEQAAKRRALAMANGK